MPTVSWDPRGPSVQMIDQRLIPNQVKTLQLTSIEEVIEAIQTMAVRGAPAIGAAAAFGLALAAEQSQAETVDALRDELTESCEMIARARPTAVNLRWALDRILRKTAEVRYQSVAEFQAAVLAEAEALAEDDVRINRRMAEFGAAELPDRATVIHHCNTGALATVDHGTALGVVFTAHEQGKQIHVLVDETRPRLQGSRLTAWELQQAGIPFDIITDNAAGYFLASGEVDAVLVGADRVAANGDVANKIGTYMLALAAQANNVPFYCVAPTSTFDPAAATGDEIPIEERDPAEVLGLALLGQPVSPADCSARNPAFDITPHRLVTAFVTEQGILRPPFTDSILQALQSKDDQQ
ncbi:MAG: S-methyl-5-thioribose-1-phosphate isomerase [Anaerolineales bacterium]|nr:S-methyl-5-thioribose-1-phosphate isomerase [Anaerolineales bacterium]